MSNKKKEQDNTKDWERLNVQLAPAQYELLNQIKIVERISLGEVSRIMFEIATYVLLDDYPKAKDRALAISHLSPETIMKYAEQSREKRTAL